FDVIFRRDLPKGGTIFEGYKSCKVFVEFTNITMPPASVDEVMIPIGVSENKLIDRLSPVVKFVNKRLSEVVGVRSTRMICNRNANATGFGIALNVIRAKEIEVAIIFFDH